MNVAIALGIVSLILGSLTLLREYNSVIENQSTHRRRQKLISTVLYLHIVSQYDPNTTVMPKQLLSLLEEEWTHLKDLRRRDHA